MKKFFVMMLAVAAMSVSASAATLNLFCGGATYDASGTVINGGNSVVCPDFNIPIGNQLLSVTLEYFVDYSYAGSGIPLNMISVQFDASPSIFSNDLIVVTQTGNGSSPGANSATGSQVSGLPILAPNTHTGATVQLSVTNMNLASSQGTVSGTASVRVSYT